MLSCVWKPKSYFKLDLNTSLVTRKVFLSNSSRPDRQRGILFILSQTVNSAAAARRTYLNRSLQSCLVYTEKTCSKQPWTIRSQQKSVTLCSASFSHEWTSQESSLTYFFFRCSKVLIDLVAIPQMSVDTFRWKLIEANPAFIAFAYDIFFASLNVLV